MNDALDNQLKLIRECNNIMTTKLQDLQKYKFIYLATPYSKYKTGQENAANDAAKIVAELLKQGVYVYSPIVHTHQVAIHGNLDVLDYKIWQAFDQPFLDVSDCLLVAKMNGWEESYGINFEIKDFHEKGKAIFYLDIETFNVLDADDHNSLTHTPTYYGH